MDSKHALNYSPSRIFKYYIHDSVAALRLQLVGDLLGSDVAELNGVWLTAKTTLVRRGFVLDLRELLSADAEGHRWLLKMKEGGAEALPAEYFESGTKPGRNRVATKSCGFRLRILRRVPLIGGTCR